jgi:hypothetical protein
LAAQQRTVATVYYGSESDLQPIDGLRVSALQNQFERGISSDSSSDSYGVFWGIVGD